MAESAAERALRRYVTYAKTTKEDGDEEANKIYGRKSLTLKQKAGVGIATLVTAGELLACAPSPTATPESPKTEVPTAVSSEPTVGVPGPTETARPEVFVNNDVLSVSAGGGENITMMGAIGEGDLKAMINEVDRSLGENSTVFVSGIGGVSGHWIAPEKEGDPVVGVITQLPRRLGDYDLVEGAGDATVAVYENSKGERVALSTQFEWSAIPKSACVIQDGDGNIRVAIVNAVPGANGKTVGIGSTIHTFGDVPQGGKAEGGRILDAEGNEIAKYNIKTGEWNVTEVKAVAADVVGFYEGHNADFVNEGYPEDVLLGGGPERYILTVIGQKGTTKVEEKVSGTRVRIGSSVFFVADEVANGRGIVVNTADSEAVRILARLGLIPGLVNTGVLSTTSSLDGDWMVNLDVSTGQSFDLEGQLPVSADGKTTKGDQLMVDDARVGLTTFAILPPSITTEKPMGGTEQSPYGATVVVGNGEYLNFFLDENGRLVIGYTLRRDSRDQLVKYLDKDNAQLLFFGQIGMSLRTATSEVNRSVNMPSEGLDNSGELRKGVSAFIKGKVYEGGVIALK